MCTCQEHKQQSTICSCIKENSKTDRKVVFLKEKSQVYVKKVILIDNVGCLSEAFKDPILVAFAVETKLAGVLQIHVLIANHFQKTIQKSYVFLTY